MSVAFGKRENHGFVPRYFEIGAFRSSLPASMSCRATAAKNVFPVDPVINRSEGARGRAEPRSATPDTIANTSPLLWTMPTETPGTLFAVRHWSTTAWRRTRCGASCAACTAATTAHTIKAGIFNRFRSVHSAWGARWNQQFSVITSAEPWSACQLARPTEVNARTTRRPRIGRTSGRRHGTPRPDENRTSHERRSTPG